MNKHFRRVACLITLDQAAEVQAGACRQPVVEMLGSIFKLTLTRCGSRDKWPANLSGF